MEHLYWLKDFFLWGTWVIAPKNNDWIVEKLGNCKSELVLLLNQTKANDRFFHCTSHVNCSFTIALCGSKELRFTSFTTSWWVMWHFPNPVLWLFNIGFLGRTKQLAWLLQMAHTEQQVLRNTWLDHSGYKKSWTNPLWCYPWVFWRVLLKLYQLHGVMVEGTDSAQPQLIQKWTNEQREVVEAGWNTHTHIIVYRKLAVSTRLA